MRPIIIANWKMQLNYRESMQLAEKLKNELSENYLAGREVVLCPSFSSLLLVGEMISDSNLKLGSQDIFWADKGAFTGAESPQFLFAAGCRYCIVGHSERRSYLNENDEMVNRKIKGALGSGLTPIVCVGETRSERETGRTDAVLIRQVQQALSEVDLIPGEQLVIAYEPVWVIGSGRTVEPFEAEHAFGVIYQTLVDLLPKTILQNNVRLIYGGSVDAQSAPAFVRLKHFSGFLVGTASLKAEDFLAVIDKVK